MHGFTTLPCQQSLSQLMVIWPHDPQTPPNAARSFLGSQPLPSARKKMRLINDVNLLSQSSRHIPQQPLKIDPKRNHHHGTEHHCGLVDRQYTSRRQSTSISRTRHLCPNSRLLRNQYSSASRHTPSELWLRQSRPSPSTTRTGLPSAASGPRRWRASSASVLRFRYRAIKLYCQQPDFKTPCDKEQQRKDSPRKCWRHPTISALARAHPGLPDGP